MASVKASAYDYRCSYRRPKEEFLRAWYSQPYAAVRGWTKRNMMVTVNEIVDVELSKK